MGIPSTAAGKRGELRGGALSEEALASSRSVLHPGRGGQRGLQQYFAPSEASQLIARVFGASGELVLDPTAGNGALLAPYAAEQRFGVELDRDQVDAGDYHAIRGDLQQVYPLLRCAGVRFRQIVLNPPFGLEWADPLTGKPVNSTVLAYRYALGLLAEDGQGALIAGRERFCKEILPRPEGNGVYAVVEIEDLFAGAVLPMVIAFFVAPSNRGQDAPILEVAGSRGQLESEELSQEIRDRREQTCGFLDAAATPSTPEAMQLAFEAAQAEHTRRRKARKKPNDHDLYLRGRGKIGVNLSPLAQLALNELGLLRDVQRLNNQASGYFALCDTRRGGCGYVHRRLRVRSTASYLSTAFRHGVVCVDELSLIKGDDSLRSRAVRALRAAHKYGFTGTPISNYVNDAFWGLWFCLSGGKAGSLRFPYDYGGGKEKFTQDFCVIEFMMGREEDVEEHLRKRRKVLPEVTNVSVLWRLTACNMIRMRKEDTGEPIVPRRYMPVIVPFGVNQRVMHRRWLKLFPDFFEHKFPEHRLVREKLVKRFAAALGQLWKLEFAATLPQADPNLDWIKHADHPEPLDEASNWTPKNLKALQLILEHVEKGEKVLVGSDLVQTGKWLCDRLTEKGVRAVHIVERNKKTGMYATKNPRVRSAKVTEFVIGDAQVLCVGVNAMRLGHNLDVASTVVLVGLPWDHASLVQFEGRVWRLTSKRPVNVFVVMTRGSLDERKWKLLLNKGAAADVALDGQLIDEPEPAVDWSQILAEMIESGAEIHGDEVPETQVKSLWDRIVPLASVIDPTETVREGPAPLPPHFPAIKPLKDSEQLPLFS